MTLVEHIYELRNRLGVALLAVLAGGVLGFLWFDYRVWVVPSLGDLLTGPYCALPQERLVHFDDGCALLQTVPFEAFLMQFKVGISAGVVLTSPVWLYQIWAFITPGLYAKERKFAGTFVGCAVVLFVGGAVLAYFVAPQGLLMLSGFGGENVVTALTATSYVNFMLGLLVIFGVSFELPLLVVMLNLVGVLSYEKLRRWRRGIIFALFIFAAVATPGTDPISMIAMAVALTILCELAIQIARINDRRKAKRRAAEGWDNLSDDEAAPFDYTPEPIEPAEPISTDGQQRVKYDDAT